MNNAKAFWSYVHLDDDADGNRISRLAADVTAQYEMITGETLSLFLDKDAINWGDDWRSKIDETLMSAAFFIPIITPRYFLSAECMREFQTFARRATSLGIKELVLPLLYVNVPGLEDNASTDDVITLTNTFQWEDWRELRFSDLSSEAYRKGVYRLASRLVEANRRLEKVDVVAAVTALNDLQTIADDSSGFLDKLAQSEETLPALVETIGSIGSVIERIGIVMQQATAETTVNDQHNKGFRGRLTIARKLATQLKEPADQIWSFGNDFVSQMHQVDDGIRSAIERAAFEVVENPEARGSICSFFGAVKKLAEATSEGLTSSQGMIDAISPIEAISRDLRPPLRRLKSGLIKMVEARELSDEWIRLIDSSPVRCEEI